MSAGNGGIFISYRRQETAWPARQLYEVLVARFGSEAVFKDVDDIEPGEDFVERITEAVAACDFLLALIGPQWLTITDATGARRLDDPEDFVRLELSAALSRGVRVVPILVDGARMPRADELPPDLAAVTRRQAVEISPVGFNTERLLTTLAAAIARNAAARAAGPAQTADPPGSPEAPAPPSAASEHTVLDPVPTPDELSGDASARSTEAIEPQQRGAAPAGSDFTQPAAQGDRPDAGSSASTQSAAPAGVGTQQADQQSAMRSAAGAGSPPQPGSPNRSGGPPPPRAAAAAAVPAGAAGRAANRRLPLLVGTAALVLAVVAGLVIWRPWSGPQASSGSAPSATPTPAPAPATPSPSASPTSQSSASLDLPQPPILAHRGGYEHHQLETMQAMEAAAREGFAVETDVRYTKDGVAVLVHDEPATKGLDCGGEDVRVSQTTWAKLKETCRSKPNSEDSNTYQIPTLNAALEALAAAHPSAWVFLEVKTDESDAKLKELLATPAKFGLSERTVFTAFSRDRLNRIAKADPSFRRMAFVMTKRVSAATLASDQLWGVAVEAGLADAEYVESLQERGLKVVVWNVNDPKQWAAVSKVGPDALMTDLPEKYRDWLADR
jgi:glycerophosphoryl diester phosphodiesterase